MSHVVQHHLVRTDVAEWAPEIQAVELQAVSAVQTRLLVDVGAEVWYCAAEHAATIAQPRSCKVTFGRGITDKLPISITTGECQ